MPSSMDNCRIGHEFWRDGDGIGEDRTGSPGSHTPIGRPLTPVLLMAVERQGRSRASTGRRIARWGR